MLIAARSSQDFAVQRQAPARNRLLPFRHSAPATSGRFRRRCDGPRPRTILLFRPPQRVLAGKTAAIASQDQFAGPTESTDLIAGQVIRAWELAYCRQPTSDELALAIKFIAGQIETMNASPSSIAEGRTCLRQAMTNLCQTLLSSNEFLYVQ